MDINVFVSMLPSTAREGIFIALAISFGVSQFISLTKTPDPNSTWGKVYKVLEVIAGIYGKAKELGIKENEDEK